MSLLQIKKILLGTTIGNKDYQKQFDRDRRDLIVSINACEKIEKNIDPKTTEAFAKGARLYADGISLVATALSNLTLQYQSKRISNLTALILHSKTLKTQAESITDRLDIENHDILSSEGELSTWFPTAILRSHRHEERMKLHMGFGVEPEPLVNEDFMVTADQAVEAAKILEELEETLLSLPGNSFDHLEDTPSSRWFVEGETDPHPRLIDMKRRDLGLGNLTDDELGNACFMCDHRRSLDSIGYLQAVKDRIRWLSRQNESLKAQLEAVQNQQSL